MPLLRRLALLLPASLIFAALLTPPATAAPPDNHGVRGASKGRPPKQPGADKAEPDQLLEPPKGADATILATELGASGQVDPVSGLGIHNPVCDQPGQIRSRPTRLSCEVNGTPESNYPASNYGFDIFITTGVTHPVGDITYGFATVLNGIWLALIFVLKLTLELLGLAFGLNPFADGKTMTHISAVLGRLYGSITDPWLSTLIVCAGIWFAYKGLLRREVAAGVGGTLVAIAMLVVGLWVVHQPRDSVGRLASLSDQMALATIGAPQSGSLARPTGSYAEAMSRTWSRLVEVPFAGLNFSDVQWALGPPPAEAVEKADERFCDDFGALALLAVLSNLGSDEAKEACAAFARKRYDRSQRVIDLYLRSSPGSPARQALWDYFDGDDRYKSKVAAQGGDGVLTRLSMLALFALGLAGAIFLLAWLAIRLFTQAAVAFVLLLAAPFALFFPLLGDSGRRAFKTWGLTLLGAIAAKMIYAVFLSVVLLGISILGQVEGPGGGATGFLMSSAFSWAVFLKRAELVGWISIGETDRQSGGGLAPGGIAAFALARRISQSGTGALSGVGRRGGHWTRARAAERGEATRETAKGSLQKSARALAEQRYRQAKHTVKKFEGSSARSSGRRQGPARAARREQASSARKEGTDASSGADRRQGVDRERYEQARDLLSGVDRNQRLHGQRWSERDLERFEAEDRELLKRSRDPADHAHRAGYDRAEFEALRGPDREGAEAAIEKATKRDRQRLDVAGNVPGRVVGRPRQAIEGLRQQREGDGPDRRERLQRLRRDRRAAPHLAARRNLSRGR